METTKDIICQVYAGQKSKKTIELVLTTFIPGYEKLNNDYTFRPDDTEYVFKTEEEMISYFIDNSGLTQTFYWNKYHDNPDNIMVGANITDDDKLIMSLTIDGNDSILANYYERLKALINSKIGTISYVNPAEYENGQDFITKFGQAK